MIEAYNGDKDNDVLVTQEPNPAGVEAVMMFNVDSTSKEMLVISQMHEKRDESLCMGRSDQIGCQVRNRNVKLTDITVTTLSSLQSAQSHGIEYRSPYIVRPRV